MFIQQLSTDYPWHLDTALGLTAQSHRFASHREHPSPGISEDNGCLSKHYQLSKPATWEFDLCSHSELTLTLLSPSLRWVCENMCVWACSPHVCTRMWRPGDNAGVLFQTLSTIFEREVSVTGLEFNK